jgi:dethiobiotin synthetase
MNGFFITGTNTGIGKTFFTALLTRHLRANNIPALALKPFCCGERRDVEILAQANEEVLSLNQINPIHLLPPLSPYAACVVEERPLDPEHALQSIQNLSQQYPGPFLIEGAGGWLVPITKNYWVRDFAAELKLPLLLVASAGLGTLNHSLLSLESMRRAGCSVAGIIMNFHQCPEDLATATNPAILEDLSGLPVYQLPSSLTHLEKIPDWMNPLSSPSID